MNETVEEVEKPKRKAWKIIVPVIVGILIFSLVGTYLYADHAISTALSESFETIHLSDLRITNVNLFPPSADCIAEYTITNPTDTDIRLKKVYFDIWIDGMSIGTLTANDKPLPSGGSTVLTCTLHLGSAVLGVLMNPPYTMKLSGEIVGSTTILFLTISRTYSKTITQIVS